MTDVEVSADGVSVTKSFEVDEFPVPTVTFDVASERDDAVTVRIVDDIPTDFDMDHVGFHPEYGSDDWTAYPEHRVEYERRLDPGETVRTVYGVRVDDPSRGDPFLEEPRIEAEPVGELGASEEAGDPVEGATMSDIAPRERTDVVRDVASGDRDDVPGMASADGEVESGAAGEAEAGGDAAPESDSPADEDPLNLSEHETTVAGSSPDDEGADEAEGDSGGDGGDGSGESDGADDPVALGSDPGDDRDATDDDGSLGGDVDVGASEGGVGAALAEEIRAGTVSDADLATISDELVDRSTDVELDHLQSRVGELEAYTDALEAFIDENGTATELLSSVEDDLEAVDGTVSELSGEVAALGDDVASVEERLDGLSGDLERALDDLDDLRGDLTALDERVSETGERVDEIDAVADDVDDLEDDLEEIQEWRDQLTDVFGA